MIFRYFSKIPSIISPLSQYVEKISETSMMAEITKHSKKDVPYTRDQINVLRDIEQAAIFHMKTLPNSKILSILKAYTMQEQGSHHLYSNISREIYKRINSFTFDELATIAYFLSSIRESGQLFVVIQDLILKDPLSIPVNSIGKLSFAYAVQEKFSPEFYNILSNIFVAGREDISIDSGLLFLTGVYKSKYTNPAILTSVEYFINKYWDKFLGEELAHVVFILFKLGLDEASKRKVAEIQLDRLNVGDINKIIGCFIARNLDLPIELLAKLEYLIENFYVSASELFDLIYVVNSFKNSEKWFEKIELVLESNLKSMTNKEKILIFLAILNTKKENLKVLEMFSEEFRNLFEIDDVLVLFPCFVRRNSMFLPYTQKLIDMMADKLRGKDIKTSDALIIMYSLSKVEYNDQNFWNACIEFVRYCKISSADEYIQVKKTVKEIGRLGADVSKCLSELEMKYEKV